jgi:hypothetical protein
MKGDYYESQPRQRQQGTKEESKTRHQGETQTEEGKEAEESFCAWITYKQQPTHDHRSAVVNLCPMVTSPLKA